MKQIKGELLVLFVHDGAAYRPVACLTSNSLARTRGIIESQTKCTPGETEKQGGVRNYSISADGEYIDTTSVGGDTAKASHDYLNTLYESDDAVNWRMSTGLEDNPFYYGNGVISDLGLDAGSGDNFTTFSLTIEGSGSILTADPLV